MRKRTLQRLPLLLWCLGAAAVVWAGRAREIHLYAHGVPFFDQWKIEGLEILLPWLKGTLRFVDFLIPHHEHVPVWTRVLVWVQAFMTGRWDPLVQTASNAALQGLFVAVLVWWLAKSFSTVTALGLTLLVTTIEVLPHAWENITWGFQSQFPLALLFLALHVIGSCHHPAGSRRWWYAQIAGLAGLFTLGSMWTAPLCVLIVGWWTRQKIRTWPWLATVAVALLGFALMLWARALEPPTGAMAQTSRTLTDFLHAWFVQMSWPAGTVLAQLPWVILMLRRRGQANTPAQDRVILVLGMWSVAQAAALAFARGGGYVGYVSRYSDLMAVGVFANAFALVRLAQDPRWRFIWIQVPLGLAWLAAVGIGLHKINTTSHTAYFHLHVAEESAIRRNAISGYLADHQLSHLADTTAKDLIYPVPATVAELLDTPGFPSLLVIKGGPSRFGMLCRKAASDWMFIGIFGGLAMSLGIVLWRPQVAAFAVPATEGSIKGTCLFLALLGAASFVGMFLWPQPFTFGEVARKRTILKTPGSLPGLSYHFTTPTKYPVSRLEGAAGILPGDIRNMFRGTHIDSVRDQVSVTSASFPLTAPYVVVPYCGHPADRGLALRLEVTDEHGGLLASHTCGANPTLDVGFWTVDVRKHQGCQARIIMVDQSVADRGWVAAAPPQMTTNADEGALRNLAWKLELAAPAHQTLFLISIISAFSLIGLYLSHIVYRK